MAGIGHSDECPQPVIVLEEVLEKGTDQNMFICQLEERGHGFKPTKKQTRVRVTRVPTATVASSGSKPK